MLIKSLQRVSINSLKRMSIKSLQRMSIKSLQRVSINSLKITSIKSLQKMSVKSLQTGLITKKIKNADQIISLQTIFVGSLQRCVHHEFITFRDSQVNSLSWIMSKAPVLIFLSSKIQVKQSSFWFVRSWNIKELQIMFVYRGPPIVHCDIIPRNTTIQCGPVLKQGDNDLSWQFAQWRDVCVTDRLVSIGPDIPHYHVLTAECLQTRQ